MLKKIALIALMIFYAAPAFAQAPDKGAPEGSGEVKDLPADIAVPAEAAPLVVELDIPEGPFKTGDQIPVTASVKNISPKDVKFDYYDPYVLFPSVREADSGNTMPVYGPPVDMVSKPKSKSIKPGQSLTLATDEITVVREIGTMNYKMPAYNASVAALPKGLYVVTYTVAPGKADGEPLNPVTVTSKSFEVSP